MRRTFTAADAHTVADAPEPPAEKLAVSSLNIKYQPRARYLTASGTAADVAAVLDEYGVAIVPNVLDAPQVAAMNAGMFQALAEVTAAFDAPVDAAQPQTWAAMKRLLPSHGFLFQHWQLGHAKYVWDVRAAPRVHAAFEALHGTPALVSSFDGVGIFLPPPPQLLQHCRKVQPPKLWLHTDERFCYKTHERRSIVQAWVTGYDVAPGSATLAFLEKSHKQHRAFGARFGFSASHTRDWFKLETPEQYAFLADGSGSSGSGSGSSGNGSGSSGSGSGSSGCPLHGITCDAGDMVLWDSRTFHCGTPPPSGVQELPRNVVYVCMTPAAWCPPKIMAKRRKNFAERRMTTHTPHTPRLFAKHPQTYGAPIPPVCPPAMYADDELSPAMRALVPLTF